MGLLSGRATWERFSVGGKAEPLTEKHVDILRDNAIRKAEPGHAATGFIAGDHLLDLDFELEKNIVNDALHGAFRVDGWRVPAGLKAAWLELELKARAADNPSGFPTKRQRKEAKEAVEERCDAEIRDGKHAVQKAVPFLLDSRNETLYFGSASDSAIGAFVLAFEQAFNRPLARISSGIVAERIAGELGLPWDLDTLTAATFRSKSDAAYAVSWLSGDLFARDFLGNEFLLWLWWMADAGDETLKLADDSKAVVWLNKSLSLECPLAETGKDNFSHESPIRLPEAKEGIRLGKLPRKAGITLVRHDEQYQLKLAAETLGVGSAALPKLESDTLTAWRQDRVDQIRHLAETVDLVFGAFIARRLNATKWKNDLRKIRDWLNEESEVDPAATAA